MVSAELAWLVPCDDLVILPTGVGIFPTFVKLVWGKTNTSSWMYQGLTCKQDVMSYHYSSVS